MTCLAAWLSPTGAACHRGALHGRTAEGGPRTEGKEPRTTTLGCWPWQRPMAKFSASASSDRSALQLGYHPSNHGHPSPASRLDSQNDVRHAQLLPEAVRLDAVTTGLPNFAECQIHSAKDILHSAKSLPSVTLGKRHSAKVPTAKFTLPSVRIRALGKGFAECPDTRQRSHVAPPWSRGLPSV
jgi:hypothetical protein